MSDNYNQNKAGSIDIKFSIKSTIRKPVEEVFNAVINPEILSTYFTTESSGPLEIGETVVWKWGSEETEVKVIESEENRTLTFRWDAYNVNYETLVEIDFKDDDEDTIVTISEHGWRDDQAGLNSSYGHCSGWQQMLCCLKARLEFNIDLRPNYN